MIKAILGMTESLPGLTGRISPHTGQACVLRAGGTLRSRPPGRYILGAVIPV